MDLAEACNDPWGFQSWVLYANVMCCSVCYAALERAQPRQLVCMGFQSASPCSKTLTAWHKGRLRALHASGRVFSVSLSSLLVVESSGDAVSKKGRVGKMHLWVKPSKPEKEIRALALKGEQEKF